MSVTATNPIQRGFSFAEYLVCLNGIVWREALRFLHQGRVLAHGPVGDIVADAGAHDINSAFMRLTGAAVDPGSPAP